MTAQQQASKEQDGSMTEAPSAAPKSRFARPKACLGYPSQNEAIIALYEAAYEPKLIAETASVAINSVHRVLSCYRRSSGRVVEPRVFQIKKGTETLKYHRMWEMEEVRLRQAIKARARAGARKTLQELRPS